ncbi:oxidoreductase, FAD-binding [Methylocaldum marinum]|uniref:Oxidoreductase, FAD-binding n=1 Tax=Methylocaldum marinum TaxID=1432792 RepID=A0A250KUE8_9GAMM|nr:FAD-linked oxidase C-terminal domain-containing protein [Methylocaldum marinum]BBA35288.1 oxidoreductase, FAD-binding [Methylocaldum marinum]
MALSDAFLSRLAQIFPPGSLFTAPADCWTYGYDNSRRQSLPDAVVFPSNHVQTVELAHLCNEHRVALTARGRGTGTTGATVPLRGGVVASFERMNRIVEFSPGNRYIVVEPGLTNQALQDFLKPHGFFWPPDPTSAAFCSIGGNLAYNSAGPRAVKYGTPRENTLALRAVTGQGTEIRTGVLTTKGVVGYDLTRLLLGSEGTLALITEATLKLTPLPQAKRTMRAVYADLSNATEAITRIMAQPAVPCALEFIDGNAIELIRRYSRADLPERAGALLMIEVDGFAEGMAVQIESVRQAARNEGLLEFRVAETADEVEALWQTRKALSPALRKVAPKKINEDVVVPVTELPKLIAGLNQLSQRFDLAIVNFGHAGNGNIHVNLLFDPAKPGETEKAHECLGEMFSLVLRLRGTLSGEHGVGLEKRDYVDQEIDVGALELMRALKRQFDPNGILNPDKTLPLPG